MSEKKMTTVNQYPNSPIALEEEVQLLLAEIASLRAIKAAESVVTREIARREAFQEVLATCAAIDDGSPAIGKAIAACTTLRNTSVLS